MAQTDTPTHAPMRLALGMMSGTSLDGVDCALLRSDGEARLMRLAHRTYPYKAALRRRLRACLDAAQAWNADGAEPPVLAELDKEVTEAHAHAARDFLRGQSERPTLIGMHGQTVLHRPQRGMTRQLGDGASLARALGIAVVWRFRDADMAAGGEGAPLAPLYHRALQQAHKDAPPLCVLNLGGVANLTFLGADGAVRAFDVGPGNGLLDDWMARQCGEMQDTDGALAAQGQVDEGLLAAWLEHAWFARPPPKSLDRLEFAPQGLERLAAADGAATLTAFTAAAVARAREHLPRADGPLRWIVCGGGRHNPSLMQALRTRLTSSVQRAEEAGWPGDEMEAQAFAYLAIRAARGLPLSLPETTGAAEPTCGGVLSAP